MRPTHARGKQSGRSLVEAKADCVTERDTAVSQGQHKLYVEVNNREIDSSPFTVTVYRKPTQLGHPVTVVTDLDRPHAITYNSQDEMIVSAWGDSKLSIFEIRGQGKIGTFGSHEMVHPAGIATDDHDNIYVSSCHQLQKFTSRGSLIKCTGQHGEKRWRVQ